MRERKTPDTIRAEASTRVSRLQAAINSLGDGDAEAKKVLESSLAKAQKQAEIPHTRSSQGPGREFSTRTRRSVWQSKPWPKQRRRRSTICENSRWQSPVWSVCRLRNESLHRDWGAQISCLMQQVNQLQAERDSFARMLTQQRVAQGEEMPAKKFRREDFVNRQ